MHENLELQSLLKISARAVHLSLRMMKGTLSGCLDWLVNVIMFIMSTYLNTTNAQIKIMINFIKLKNYQSVSCKI